ncbi:hypothetical protein [Streptomyces sp. P3]|uniref:hypothetical protein n=1 Tax=Streptomyces sp. P3 TaxID=2135430 RepID=UPI00131EF091|nr:hypothetical protein [Streptomyces sp. P3]
MSVRTLERLAVVPSGESLITACADGRWTRKSGGHPSVTEEIREAVFAVRQEVLQRSRISMRARHRLMRQYVRETFPQFPEGKIPATSRCGTSGRSGSARTAPASATCGQRRRRRRRPRGSWCIARARWWRWTPHHTTPLPVKVRESVFGDPVTVMLTLALDLYTHSIVAFRLTMVSDTAMDVAMLLRDVMMPLPMREGWRQDMEWPYPGVPATLIARFAGHKVAALPFFPPETVTTDHGAPYKNHDVVEAERTLGCTILPARALRATDKCAVERAFGAINSLLLKHLLGFTGVDVADRGADPEAESVLTMSRMEHLIATWVVKVWQNRVLGEHAPSWGPGEEHSPNSLFAASMHQGGFSMQIPRPELYYQVLKAHHVKIHPGRGVKIGGLWSW